MPRHHLYLMDSEAKAPAGDGDVRSWFLFYKWKVEGEVWVPQGIPFLTASPDDFLWFAFGRVVFGGAQIVRVEIEESQRRQELWYSGQDVFELFPPHIFVPEWLAVRQVPAEVAERWLTTATRSSTANPP